ncbi:MAG: MFS transporter [Myxococcota bacterium]
MALSSSAGQTFFVSLFSGEIRAELGLSHGDFGWLYTIATVCSAVALSVLGQSADRFHPVPLAAAVLLGLSCAALGMSFASGVWFLGAAVFGLRFCGQGMLSHIMFTALGRWFTRSRGRALSLAGLGFSVGSASLPWAATHALDAWDWRHVWLLTAGIYLLALIPALGLLALALRRFEPEQDRTVQATPESPGDSWSRGAMLRDPRWYAVMPGVLMPPFVITGVLFHQIHLVETKAWSLGHFAGAYPAFAGCAVVVSLASGPLVDRFGAARLLPFYLVPMVAGLCVLGLGEDLGVIPVFMALFGSTSGAAVIVLGALWPELYGVTHLGAIRSVIMMAMVFATALAPGLMGALLDRGVRIESQCLALAGATSACVLLNLALQPALRRTA